MIASAQHEEAVMPEPKKATAGQQKRRAAAAPRTTKSTARAAKPAGARTRKPPATAEAKAAEPGVEAAEKRIRELNERIIDAGKRAGRGTLGIYESTLKAVSDSLERGPGSSDIEWVSSIATAQANFLRDLTKAWTSAARKALK
jgi:hypothetical protein